MTSEPEPLPDGTEITLEDPESPTDSTEVPSTGEARANGMAFISRMARRCLAQWRSVLLAALTITAIGLAVIVFLFYYRPDRLIDDTAARRAIKAASDGAVATVSYSSDTMDRDFANAKSHLTGDFLTYYDKFTKEIVAPTVRQKQIAQTATVIRAAVSELHPNSAIVLVFLNETTTSKDKREPLTTPSSVRITLTKVDGSWLISRLDPYG